MEKELDKTGEETVTTPSSELKVEAETTKVEEAKPEVQEDKAAQIKAKEEELNNLAKAIAEEQNRLREIRQQKKLAKQGSEEEELQIDLNDPSAKAWDKRIREFVRPAEQELEKAKEERRLWVLRQFLSNKPSLSKNPEKVKAMMETYDRLKTSTELTNEGIESDLQKAYAAEHYEELMDNTRQSRVETARDDALFSDIAVSRGSTAYKSEQSKPRVYTEEEKAQLAKWNMTPQEHSKLVEEQKAKVG